MLLAADLVAHGRAIPAWFIFLARFRPFDCDRGKDDLPLDGLVVIGGHGLLLATHANACRRDDCRDQCRDDSLVNVTH